LASLITDREKLVGEDPFGHRSLILDSLDAGIRAVLPENLLRNSVHVNPTGILEVRKSNSSYDLRKFDRIIVVGAGKAAGAMAQCLEGMLSSSKVEFSGAVNVPQGTSGKFSTKKIELNEATHPLPSRKGVKGTLRILKALQSATSKSLVVCLISGGGSALLPLPAVGITLGEKVSTTNLLLKSGANIDKMNCVRKHLSAIKGGQLPLYANGAKILTLIISDIVGNPLENIASGPTAPDTTTFADALRILKQFTLLAKVPRPVLSRLEKGARGELKETPKPGDRLFANVENVLLGDNSDACKAIIQSLRQYGLREVAYLSSAWEGEARIIGGDLASACIEMSQEIRLEADSQKKSKGSALVWGGETTVTVTGSGRGGRNQEAALGALRKVKSMPGITMSFLGTDGVDGFSDAAGALVDSIVYNRAQKLKLVIDDYLENNDSNTFFDKTGAALISTGPTGTNVNDVGIAIFQHS
jgi:glycerate 2-kinase